MSEINPINSQTESMIEVQIAAAHPQHYFLFMYSNAMHCVTLLLDQRLYLCTQLIC